MCSSFFQGGGKQTSQQVSIPKSVSLQIWLIDNFFSCTMNRFDWWLFCIMLRFLTCSRAIGNCLNIVWMFTAFLSERTNSSLVVKLLIDDNCKHNGNKAQILTTLQEPDSKCLIVTRCSFTFDHYYSFLQCTLLLKSLHCILIACLAPPIVTPCPE